MWRWGIPSLTLLSTLCNRNSMPSFLVVSPRFSIVTIYLRSQPKWNIRGRFPRILIWVFWGLRELLLFWITWIISFIWRIICSVRTASEENPKICQISHFVAHFSLKLWQKVLHNLIPYNSERLKFIFQLGQNFRFDDKPEVDRENHRARPSASRAIKSTGAVFHGASDEGKI